MKTPGDLFKDVKTRGDLRRMSASAQQQSDMRESAKARLFPLWEAMATTWSSFVSLYGEEPTPAWIVGLQHVSDEQLMTGYQAALLDNLEFPPNLSRFVEYCNPAGDWEHRRIEAAERARHLPPVDLGEGRLLEAPRDDRKPAEHLASMREALGL